MSADSSSFTLVRVYGILTKVQSASAIVYSTYLLIHGTQILSANMGGVELANRSLLMTRPFYQDKGIETVLVLGSALVHVVTGLAKFGIRTYWKQLGQSTTHPSLMRHHRLVGHLQIPLVGLHYYLARVLPIQRYGDSSFIDFSYIAWGLQNRPLFTYGLHTTLIVGSMYHAVGGLSFIYTKYFKRNERNEVKVSQNSKSREHQLLNEKSRQSQKMKRGVITALSLTLISGLVIICKDTNKIPLRADFESMYSRILSV